MDNTCGNTRFGSRAIVIHLFQIQDVGRLFGVYADTRNSGRERQKRTDERRSEFDYRFER